MPSIETMKEWIDKKEWLEDFFAFLRFPSVSSEVEFAAATADCANWLARFLRSLDFEVEIWQPKKGHPIVFASHLEAGPDQPTLLIYHHYDVQPADPINLWKHPPFEPHLEKGEIYARGAQDNKGQCFYTLQALKMLKELQGTYPINLKLCIEGEEEIGSAGLASLLKEKQEHLKADYLAIVDLGLRDPKTAALTLGLRGIITLDVELEGASTDLHSGSHGGIAPNPIHALISLLASMRDEKGRITVPGFLDDVKELSLEERKAISFAFDEQMYKEQTGVEPKGGELDYSAIERGWLRPTLEINGITGGYTGEGFKTVIPAKASAKLSCRLVPDQDPSRIGHLLKKYMEENAPAGIKVAVRIRPGNGKAVRASADAFVVKAFAQAFAEVFQKPCEFIFEGASIPIVPELTTACGAETVLFGLGLATDHIHAPNEHFGLDRLKKGMLLMARGLQLLRLERS